MEQDRVVEEFGLLPVPAEELVLSARLELGGRVSGDKLSVSFHSGVHWSCRSDRRS